MKYEKVKFIQQPMEDGEYHVEAQVWERHIIGWPDITGQGVGDTLAEAKSQAMHSVHLEQLCKMNEASNS